MAAQLKGNQMVLLVVGHLRVGVAVRLDLLCLEGVCIPGRWPDLSRVATYADGGEDVVLRDSGIGDPRSADWVGQSVDRVAFAGDCCDRRGGTDSSWIRA